MSIFAGKDPIWTARRGTVSAGLVGHWDSMALSAADRMGNIWYDISGNNNHGTLTNGASFDRIGVNFDGVNDYVNVPDATVLNFDTGNFTVCAWVRTTETTRRTVVSKYDYNGLGTIETGWYIDVRADGRLRTAIETVTAGAVNYRVLDSNATVNDGNWHCITLQRTAQNTINVFVDGNQSNGASLTQGTVVSVSNTVALRIGEESDKGVGSQFNQYFLGNIDDVRIYNRTLSNAEILRNFNATRARFGV